MKSIERPSTLNDSDHRRAPRISDSKSSQQRPVTDFESPNFPRALNGYGNSCGDRVSRFFHIDPIFLDRNLELGPQSFQHEFISLMRNHQINIVECQPALLQQLIYHRRHSPDGEAQDFATVHEEILVRAAVSVSVVFLD